MPNAPVNNSAAAGDLTVVLGISGQKIRVHGYALQSSGPNTVTLKFGSTPLTGPLSSGGGGNGTLSRYHPGGWFVGGNGESFIVNSANPVQISGHVNYSFAGVVPAWTPAGLGPALYGQYVVQPGYVWQDSARTIPAVSFGDPVGALDDQSGNGRHLIQATATKRPTLRSVGPLYYLQFDGVDDCLVASGVSYALGGVTLAASISMSTAGSYPMILTGSLAGYSELLTKDNLMQPTMYYNGQGVVDTFGMALGTKYTLLARGNPTAIDIWRDGVQTGVNIGAAGTTQTEINLGQRTGGLYFWTGGIFTAVVCNASVSDADAKNLSDWLTSRI